MSITYDGLVINKETMNNLKKVSICAIARQLGRIVRFGGATEKPISVLTHSLSVALLAHEEVIFLDLPVNTRRIVTLALLHDASEAIISDIPYPWKTDSMRKVEKEIEEKLFEGWELIPPSDEEYKIIKRADNNVVKAEASIFGLKNFREDRLDGEITSSSFEAVNLADRTIPFWQGFNNPLIWNKFQSAAAQGNLAPFYTLT